MDIGNFVSYELGHDSLSTKLFRKFTLNTIPLKKIKVLKKATDEDITPLNRINWLGFLKKHSLCPIYMLQADEDSPCIFMRLDHGSQVVLKNRLEQLEEK